MGYVSFEFVILLLAALLVFYFWPRKFVKYRYFVLLLASYVFVMYADWRWGIILFANTVISYFCGIFTFHNKKIKEEKYSSINDGVYAYPVREYKETTVRAKTWVPMVISIVLNVGLLLVTKYTNWIGESLFSFLDKPFDPISFIVPLGISFYVFTIVAYNIDVYKGKIQAERNFFKFATFVSFFPKLAQGPITRYSEASGEGGLYGEHSFVNVDFLAPAQRIVRGLFKKVLIADILGVYVTYIWGNYSSLPGYFFPLVGILYAIELYCDFSGYMDMSLGVAGLFGIKLPENFDVPYMSKTVQEFWRRWHATLGSWLRDYIYFPLGGSRVASWRVVVNTMIVWLVSGLWHGADWTYLIWGLYFGVLLVLGRFTKPYFAKYKQYQGPLATFLRIFRTFALVCIGWAIFSAPSLDAFLHFAKRMLTDPLAGSFSSIFNGSTLPWSYFLLALLATAVLVALYFSKPIQSKLPSLFTKPSFKASVCFALSCLAVVSAVYMTVKLQGIGVSTSDFIYFEF